jgi:hypothetical protein
MEPGLALLLPVPMYTTISASNAWTVQQSPRRGFMIELNPAFLNPVFLLIN